MDKPYRSLNEYYRVIFDRKTAKISLDGGFTCPNRDGTLGVGGCIFCSGSGSGEFAEGPCADIRTQLERAKSRVAEKNRSGKYIAYFQSGTNTNASVDVLEKLYSEALGHPAVSGIIIGTRPDCISSEILDLLFDLSQKYYVAVEYGIESMYDATLQHVNRGHSFADAQRAVRLTRERGIDVGAHFILGLPNETTNDILAGIHHINALGIDFIKFHQLQIYRNTALEHEWREHPERFLFGTQSSTEEYTNLLVEIIRRLDPRIAIERLASQAPRNLIVHSPLKGIRPHELRDMVVNRMLAENLRQGDLYPFAL